MNQMLREEIVAEIWNEIHGRFKSVFYWMNGTKTEYHYDPVSDSIISDNGFSVRVSVSDDKLTRDYIYGLIERLEGDIAEYYRIHYNIIL